ncbi:hypothetical protein C3F09_08285 [candidate division GN15 bacterium]|uniref:Nudix hydrolase domain-containing protein n=1 Tax=candidate division GN15 bacterium TaxID=2072418 RepID=A0A855X5H5_9BACT|nr:MAG: hypothetical protein C3F09_08285 [candidate division GN15 bacterium]
MSTYLDMQRFAEFVTRHFNADSQRRERMVGASRQHDSWYFDIKRFFGAGAIDPSAVPIRYEQSAFVQRDSLIAAFTQKIETALRAQGRLYEGPPAVQITRADWIPEEPSVAVRSIRYGDQAASFAMDLDDPAFRQWGGTLRDYIRIKYPSTKLEDLPLCAGVGVCGMVVLEDAGRRHVVRVRRSATLASLENTVGPSVAGSVEFADNFSHLAELIERSIERELEEELGLAAGKCHITPLAYAREMVRGNRPQLFAVVETKLDRTQISDRINALPAGKREFSEYTFLPFTNGCLSAADIEPFNFEAKMCYYLMEEWLG